MSPFVIAVVGTGTGIGKTHVTAALAREAVRRGLATAGRKPIESGFAVWETSDAGVLDAAGSVPAATRPPYLFREPVSPHLAARRVGATIDVAEATAWCRSSSTGAAVLLVETAGAILSPLVSPRADGPARPAEIRTNLDLLRALAPDAVLLVAPDRLGVLHEVSSGRVVLAEPLWARTLVTLVAPETADGSTGTNAGELAVLGIALGATTWARDPGGSAPGGPAGPPGPPAPAAALLDALLAR